MILKIKKPSVQKLPAPTVFLTQDAKKIKEQVQAHFSRSNLPLPTRLEYYRIGRTLGRGAFGKVSLCLHKLSHSLVAIKSIKKGASLGVKQRALEEMQLIQ